MKYAFLVLIWTWMSVYGAWAQSVKDPIKDPLRDYLTSRDIGRDPEMPLIKKLFMIKCDLDNSGKDSILITFNGYGGRQGNYWTVYLPASNGYVKAKTNGSEAVIIFKPDMFYLGTVNGTYGLLAFAPGRGGGDLNLFTSINGKISEQKIATLDLSNAQDKAEFQSYFGEAPDWKSLKDYPMKTMSLTDLSTAGYDIHGAIKAAQAADHQLH